MTAPIDTTPEAIAARIITRLAGARRKVQATIDFTGLAGASKTTLQRLVATCEDAQAEIARLTAERDAALIRAERSERAERAAHDAANTAIRQRDVARAQVAMVIEKAAKVVHPHDQSGVNCNWRGMADTVRALTPAGPAAALAARDAAMRNEGRRQAAAACDWGDIYGDNAVRAILAALEPEGGE